MEYKVNATLLHSHYKFNFVNATFLFLMCNELQNVLKNVFN